MMDEDTFWREFGRTKNIDEPEGYKPLVFDDSKRNEESF